MSDMPSRAFPRAISFQQRSSSRRPTVRFETIRAVRAACDELARTLLRHRRRLETPACSLPNGHAGRHLVRLRQGWMARAMALNWMLPRPDYARFSMA